MHSEDNTIFGHDHKILAQYPLNHVIYTSAFCKVAKPYSKGVDSITRNVTGVWTDWYEIIVTFFSNEKVGILMQ